MDSKGATAGRADSPAFVTEDNKETNTVVFVANFRFLLLVRVPPFAISTELPPFAFLLNSAIGANPRALHDALKLRG